MKVRSGVACTRSGAHSSKSSSSSSTSSTASGSEVCFGSSTAAASAAASLAAFLFRSLASRAIAARVFVSTHLTQILECKQHPDADSLYVEQEDVAEDAPRTIV